MFSQVAPSLGRSVLLVAGAALVATMMLAGADRANAAGDPGDNDFLGAAGGFAVLAGSTVTNTGPTVITGELGVSPGSAVTGFPPGIMADGDIHTADADAGLAQSDLVTAYTTVAGLPSDIDLTGQDLGGLTLTSGVYSFDSSAQLTGNLTLDAEGDPGAVFVFQSGSTLTAASSSSVLLTNGAQPCNVFWQVGSSATLGTSTTFVGSIFALTSISANTGSEVAGRLLARNGAVTLDTTNVTRLDCAPEPSTTTLTASPNPVTVGTETVLTATVTGDTPTGTVEFFAGTSSLGTAPVTDGTATLTVSTLTIGDHSVTAVYSGDSVNATSTSGAVTITVVAAPAELPATGVEAGIIGLGGALLSAAGILAVTARRRSNA